MTEPCGTFLVSALLLLWPVSLLEWHNRRIVPIRHLLPTRKSFFIMPPAKRRLTRQKGARRKADLARQSRIGPKDSVGLQSTAKDRWQPSPKTSQDTIQLTLLFLVMNTVTLLFTLSIYWHVLPLSCMVVACSYSNCYMHAIIIYDCGFHKLVYTVTSDGQIIDDGNTIIHNIILQ